MPVLIFEKERWCLMREENWGGGVVGKVFLGQRRVHCVFLCVKSLSSL